jgi:hypothetical protein
MGFFKSFQNELGRNAAKYVSNKILGESGWATPKRHIIDSTTLSAYTNVEALNKGIYKETDESVNSEDEKREINKEHKKEYLLYIDSIQGYHKIVSQPWQWKKGKKGTIGENDYTLVKNNYFPDVFDRFDPIDHEYINEFLKFYTSEIVYLGLNLTLEKLVDLKTFDLEHNIELHKKCFDLLSSVFLYHVTYCRNESLYEKPDTKEDLKTLLNDIKGCIEIEIEKSNGMFGNFFKSNKKENKIKLEVSKTIESFRSYFEAFVAHSKERGDRRAKIIEMSVKGLSWALFGKGNPKDFFSLVTELGHFDRFNEEGVSLEFDQCIGGIVFFNLYIDPKIKIPGDKVLTIYNDLKLKTEPITKSEHNEILYNLISSMVMSLGIELNAMNLDRIDSIGLYVFIPNSSLEDQCILRLSKEISFFSDTILSEMNASVLLSMFNENELKVNYSKRAGFTEII